MQKNSEKSDRKYFIERHLQFIQLNYLKMKGKECIHYRLYANTHTSILISIGAKVCVRFACKHE